MKKETLLALADEYDSVKTPSEALMFAAAVAEAAAREEAEERGETNRFRDLTAAALTLDGLRREVLGMERE